MSTPPEEITNDPPIPEPHDPGEGDGDGDQPDQGTEGTEPDDAEPDEDDAEEQASAEREADLAAERQQEAQSIEAQAREQDAKRKKLDQLAGHVAKRYHDILGDDLDGFVGCPLCAEWFPGIRLPVQPSYETVAAVKVAIGEDPDPPLKQDIHSIVCSDCDGLGKVLTGSKVNSQKAAQCIACGGTGWQPTDNTRQRGTVTATNGTSQPAPLTPADAATDAPEEVARLRALGWTVVEPIEQLMAQQANA